MKKTKLATLALVVAVLVLPAVYHMVGQLNATPENLNQLSEQPSRPPKEVPVWFLEDESYHHNFTVDEETGQVVLRDQLALRNQTGRELEFTVFLDYKADEAGGLLRQSLLQAVDEATEQKTFVIGPGETADYDVRCVGKYAGKPTKAHRELPDGITIQVDGTSYTWQREARSKPYKFTIM